MKKGSYRTHCKKCDTERILLNNGRYICPKCAREYSLKNYHTNKKPLTTKQKENKKISNLKWKYTIRDSGFTNQQVTVIKNRYKLPEEELVNLVNKQDCKCAICGKELNKNINSSGDKSNDLCVDHCHNTNKVRGLLCRDCNFGLGLFKDDVNNLINAIKYLKNETL
jgi:hypothetical protein